jgi:flagellin
MVNVNRNVFEIGINNQIDRNSGQLKKIFEQLSSGNRITSAAVDAAGSAIAERLEATFRGLTQQINQDQYTNQPLAN